jgi:two-component system nitrate/nitrite response regulator NarL
MIVDDHALVRNAVRRALDGSDLELAAEASSAQEALDLAPEARPDLILLDIDLRGTRGIEIIRTLKHQLPNVRIVMLTVSAADEDVDDAIGSGASGYLTKDLTSEALLRAIRGAINGDLAMPRRMAQALVDRMSGATGPVENSALSSLSGREREILKLLCDGLTAREIAAELVLSPRTVEGYVGNVLHKLGVRNRIEAVRAYRGYSVRAGAPIHTEPSA